MPCQLPLHTFLLDKPGTLAQHAGHTCSRLAHLLKTCHTQDWHIRPAWQGATVSTHILSMAINLLLTAHFRLIRIVAVVTMAKQAMTPTGRGSGNSKSTPQAKAKAKAHGTPLNKAPQALLTKAHGTPLTKAPQETPKTPSRQQAFKATEEEAHVSRTRRKRGGRHMERDGSSGFLSTSITTMFMCRPLLIITCW